MSTEFYVYIYLNPLKPGKYTYNDFISFQFEPFYVGKGKNRRLYDHIKYGPKQNTLFKGILNKLKKQNIEPIIIKLNINLLEEKAFDLEKFYIKTIGRRDLSLGPLSNMTEGGDGSSGYKHTEETKQIISKTGKGRNLGRKHTEETKQKIKKARACQVITEEHRKKISKSSVCAKPIIFRNKKYRSLYEARRQSGVSLYSIKKECEYITK